MLLIKLSVKKERIQMDYKDNALNVQLEHILIQNNNINVNVLHMEIIQYKIIKNK